MKVARENPEECTELMPPNELEQARQLVLPSREEMLRRDPTVHHFWESNRQLLQHAWEQWDRTERGDAPRLGDSLLDETLREAVDHAWQDPATESTVRELWHEVLPGVFHTQFFDPKRLGDLRRFLDEAADAQIPLRPPYGIVLNRGGAMLDQRSAGYLAAPEFQELYRELLDRYMRPIARLLLPDVAGYDTQTFGFSIRYQPTTDTSIRPHSDASAVTLNINLNLPDEEYSGSAVEFIDHVTGRTAELSFAPGTAVMHRGNVPHVAHPITSGTRSNIVLWLYGASGRVQPTGAIGAPTDPEQRWEIPSDAKDDFAPF